MLTSRKGMSRTDFVLLLLVAVGLVAAAPQLARRWQVERANRTVTVAVDAADLQRLAATQPGSLESLLSRVRQRGAAAVAVSEQTLEDLQGSGLVQLVPAGLMSLRNPDTAGGGGLWITFTDDDGLSRQVAMSLRSKFPEARVRATEAGLVFVGSENDLRDFGLALPVRMIQAAGAAGLDIVLRLRNYDGVTPAAIQLRFSRAHDFGARMIVFEGDQVLGYPGLIELAAKALGPPRHLGGLLYGAVELVPQAGDDELGRLLKGREVRVHSISAEELKKMTPDAAVGRFVRAVQERNVRVCYVRLFQGAQPSQTDYNMEYVGSLCDSVRAAGFTLGRAEPLPPLGVPLPLRVAMALGVAAAGVLLVRRMLPVGEGTSWALVAAGSILLGGLVLRGGGVGFKLAALLAATAFPSLGMVWLVQSVARGRPGASTARALAAAAGRLAGASWWSLVGGLYVGALLAQRTYLVKADQFVGIKAATALPVVLAAMVIVGRMSGQRGKGYLRQVGEDFRSFFSRPVLLWQAAAALVIAGVALLVVLRTGNEPLVKPSAGELGMRNFLEDLLIARPRTKEFLLGHPALMLGAALAIRQASTASGWAALLLVAGAIGQVSITNTYCHLHSPLWLCLLRTFNGLWVGAIIGAIVTAGVLRLVRPGLGAGGKQGESAGAA